MTENEKTTALIPSVGADGGQPPHNSSNQSIPHETCESNPPEENIEEMRERIRRMNDPRYLHTVSMTELYQTVYKSRPPVIDGLLYSGAYILAGAPKIGKSFLVAQLAYHVSTGRRLWGYEVHQGTVLYLALEDDFQRIQSRMFMMSIRILSRRERTSMSMQSSQIAELHPHGYPKQKRKLSKTIGFYMIISVHLNSSCGVAPHIGQECLPLHIMRYIMWVAIHLRHGK